MDHSRMALHIKKLQTERARTLLKLTHLREALKSEADPEFDEGDPVLAEHEKVVALVQGLEHKLDSIDYALQQTQKGTYGICERCGEPIDPARLEAVPETTLCLKCKQIAERRAPVKRVVAPA